MLRCLAHSLSRIDIGMSLAYFGKHFCPGNCVALVRIHWHLSEKMDSTHFNTSVFTMISILMSMWILVTVDTGATVLTDTGSTSLIELESVKALELRATHTSVGAFRIRTSLTAEARVVYQALIDIWNPQLYIFTFTRKCLVAYFLPHHSLDSPTSNSSVILSTLPHLHDNQPYFHQLSVANCVMYNTK